MVNKICVNGIQEKQKGNGIYFICQFDWQEKGEEWRTGSPCRFARWCEEDRKYYASTDESRKMCPHFSMFRPEPIPEPVIIKSKVIPELDVAEEDTDDKDVLETKSKRSYTRKKTE